jgi:predicted deacetylase
MKERMKAVAQDNTRVHIAPSSVGASPGLLVSIHDVTPAFDVQIRRLWELCRFHAVTPALLVVPNWHGAWPLDAHPDYVRWIRERAADGAEIILHGERHDEVGLRRSLRDAWRAVGRTNREGEFLTLDTDDARQRIDRGLALLRGFGLAPTGFIPPAWLCREETHDVVRDAGLHFSEDAQGIRLHRRNARVVAPALRWSARTTVRARLSSAIASLRWTLHQGVPVLRIALHPQDLQHPDVERSIERELERWMTRKTAVRYDSL